jgi:hypothetical protein
MFLNWKGGVDPSFRKASEEGGFENRYVPVAWIPDLVPPDPSSIRRIYSIHPDRPLRKAIQCQISYFEFDLVFLVVRPPLHLLYYISPGVERDFGPSTALRIDAMFPVRYLLPN